MKMINKISFLTLFGWLWIVAWGDSDSTLEKFFSNICTPCSDSTKCPSTYQCTGGVCVFKGCSDDNDCNGLLCIKSSCCSSNHTVANFAWSSQTVSSICVNKTCDDVYGTSDDNNTVCATNGQEYENKTWALCAGNCVASCHKTKTSAMQFLKTWSQNLFKGNYVYYSGAVILVVVLCCLLSCCCIYHKCRKQRNESINPVGGGNRYSWGNDNRFSV